MHVALDKATGDLLKPRTGGVLRVRDGRFIIQQVQCKLRTFLGEWLPDPSVGFLNEKDFIRNYNRYDIEARATKIIIETQGVERVLSLDISMEGRGMTLTFSARTTFGTIDASVPWDNIPHR